MCTMWPVEVVEALPFFKFGFEVDELDDAIWSPQLAGSSDDHAADSW